MPTGKEVTIFIGPLKAGSYEQVIAAAAVIKRGSSTPLTFKAIAPEGHVNSHSYKDEGVEWDRTIFVHGSQHAVPVGGGRFEWKPTEQGSEFIRPTFNGDTSNSRETTKQAKHTTQATRLGWNRSLATYQLISLKLILSLGVPGRVRFERPT